MFGAQNSISMTNGTQTKFYADFRGNCATRSGKGIGKRMFELLLYLTVLRMLFGVPIVGGTNITSNETAPVNFDPEDFPTRKFADQLKSVPGGSRIRSNLPRKCCRISGRPRSFHSALGISKGTMTTSEPVLPSKNSTVEFTTVESKTLNPPQTTPAIPRMPKTTKAFTVVFTDPDVPYEINEGSGFLPEIAQSRFQGVTSTKSTKTLARVPSCRKQKSGDCFLLFDLQIMHLLII